MEHRIGDRRVIRLISKWLSAGVMKEGEWRDNLRGTPQGSIVSPVLANVYLHYVLDLWFQRTWRARTARGDTIIVRYADDFVVGFQYKRDAEQFLCDLKDRLAAFSLELHPDKTRLIEFGKFAMADRRARGERRPETFDFLGFTHYCRTTRTGRFGLGRKPIKKRVNRTLKRIKAELRRRMHHNIYEVAKWLGRVTGGWLRYFAVPTSFPSLRQFVFRLKRMWLPLTRSRAQPAQPPCSPVSAPVRPALPTAMAPGCRHRRRAPAASFRTHPIGKEPAAQRKQQSFSPPIGRLLFRR